MNSKTVRRPSSSLAVVTTPSGLWKASQRRATTLTALPPTVMRLPVGVHLAAELRDLPVHPYAPRADQFLGRAARGDAGPGQGALQSHFAHDSAGT